MTDNPYKSPESNPLAPQFREQEQQFYVVSKVKFTLLFVMTLGFYEYYWLAVNWYRHRKATGISVWPLPRALFPIFFTHTLISAIDERLNKNNIIHRWNPLLWATLYVLAGIAYGILGEIIELSYGDSEAKIKSYAAITVLIESTFVLIDYFILLQILKAINIGHADPTGSSNSKLTVINYFWILLGLIFIVLSIIYFAETLGIISTNELLTLYHSS